MTPQEAVLAIVRLLWIDYGVAFPPEEEPILALKLLVLIEMVEEETRRRERRCEASVN